MGEYRSKKQVVYNGEAYRSVSEMCRECGLHRSKVYRMIDRGEVEYSSRTTNRTTTKNRTSETAQLNQNRTTNPDDTSVSLEVFKERQRQKSLDRLRRREVEDGSRYADAIQYRDNSTNI